MSQRVLVTGASGFVGGALGRWLRSREGLHVTGLSRGPPREGACDEAIAHDLRRLLPGDLPGFDVVVHCAALASPWASPAAYRRTNVDALRNLLDALRTRPPRRFVFVSSSAVHYAFADQLDLREDSPWPERAINLYAASKRAGEAMVRDSGLPWTIVRPRAVFGPEDTVVFPRLLEAARRGAAPRLVRKDGEAPIADLLFIDNLCWFLARIITENVGGVFNLTNGEPVRTPDFLDEVFERLGLPKPQRRVSVSSAMMIARAMEVISATLLNWREPPVTRFGVASLAYSKTFDIARARAVLGEPPVSLAEGVDAFIRWQAPRLA